METSIIQNFVLTERDFHKISKLVYEHCGINLHDDKKELVRARLTKRLRKGNFKSFSDYMKHVLGDKTGKEFSILVDSLSTNVTSFFREGQHFEFLQKRFLPSLLERKRKSRESDIVAKDYVGILVAISTFNGGQFTQIDCFFLGYGLTQLRTFDFYRLKTGPIKQEQKQRRFANCSCNRACPKVWSA